LQTDSFYMEDVYSNYEDCRLVTKLLGVLSNLLSLIVLFHVV
jgi:hypothetical protein